MDIKGDEAPLSVSESRVCSVKSIMFSSFFDGLVYSFSEEHKQYYLDEIKKLNLTTEERVMVAKYLENLETRRYNYNNLPEPTKETIEELYALFKASCYIDEFQLYGFLALWCLNKTRKTTLRVKNHASMTRAILVALDTYPERFVKTTPNFEMEQQCGWHCLLNYYLNNFKSMSGPSEISCALCYMLDVINDWNAECQVPEVVRCYWLTRIHKEWTMKLLKQ